MAHLKDTRDRSAATPAEWLALGAQIAQQCNDWATREDIVGFVGEGAGGATACWKPQIAEMEVNLEVAFGEGVRPEWVGDFTRRKTHFEFPKAAGAVMHEAGHARFTRFPLEQLFGYENKAVRTVAEMMEESRIEGLMRAEFPRNRSFLRTCALDIVMADIDYDEIKERGAFGLSLLLLLTLARVDAGVLEESDVETLRSIAEASLGKPLLAELRELWLQAQAHRDHENCEKLLELGHKWMDLLVEHGAMSEEEAEAAGKGTPSPGGEGGEGGSGIPEALREAIEEMLEAMAEAAEDAAFDGMQEAAEQEAAENAEAEAARRGEVAREVSKHEQEAAEMFGKGSGPVASRETASRLIERRAPTSEERAAAVKVGKLLDKARYQDRVVTPVKTILPPGRLATRQAVQGVADIRRVGMTSQEPWRAKKRKHVDDPELKIGYLVDISGSMSSAMQPMAANAWIFSEAARRMQAKLAMVYYGTGVFPTLRPGQHLTEVNVYNAPDGTERFDKAARVMDGALNLLHGSGARLVVISSDMCYSGGEPEASRRWVKRLLDAGVAVLILTYDGSDGGRGHYTRDFVKMGATVIGKKMTASETADVVGRAAAEAIERASARRNAG